MMKNTAFSSFFPIFCTKKPPEKKYSKKKMSVSSNSNVYHLKEVEELFAQEQALMGLLKNAVKDHEATRACTESNSNAALALLQNAEHSIQQKATQQTNQAWPDFLDMPNPDLCKKNPPTELVSGMRGLKAQLMSLQKDMSGVWPEIFSTLVAGTANKLDEIDARNQHIIAEPKGDVGVALLPQPLLVRLEVLASLGSSLDTTSAIETIAAIRAQLKDLSVAQSMPMDATTSGQVGWAKVQLQTKLVENIKNLIRCIEAAEVENTKLSNHNEICVVAEQQAAQIKEPRLRMKMQCESALRSVKQAVSSMDNAHTQESNQFQNKITLSKQNLDANVNKQNDIWKKMSELYEELGALTLERSGEVQFQIENYGAECKRREEYKWAKQVAEEHMRMLGENIQNCETAIKFLDTTETFVKEGTETAGRYQDATAVDLSTQRGALIQEVERELSVLHSWTTEHRMYVQDQLHHRAPTPGSPAHVGSLSTHHASGTTQHFAPSIAQAGGGGGGGGGMPNYVYP